MPYNPGVTDISGQLLAQGVLGRAQAYSGGMDAITKGIQARQLKDEQDQALLAKAKSTEAFIKAHSDMFGGDEAVKQMTATDPREAPVAKYARLTQAVQDTVVGKSMEREQQQTAQIKQQAAAAQFALQQKQQAQQRDDAQRQRFEQMRAMINGVAPTAPQWAGSGSGPWAGMPTGQTSAPPAAAGQTPALDPLTAQSLAYFKATGRVPDSNAMTTMMGDTSRQQIADERTKYATQRVNDQLDSREAIAGAQEETKRLKQQMNDGPPRYHTDPETGLRSVFTGAQWQVMPGQVAKDPKEIMIDRLVASGSRSKEWGDEARARLLQRAALAPQNNMAEMVNAIRGNTAGAPAAPVKPDDGFWLGGQQPAGSPASRYTTPDALIAAVRAGTLSAADAKEIAKKNGWGK